MDYAKNFNTKETLQSDKIPNRNQVLNNAGGYVFKIDLIERVKRFLILGSDSNTYYQTSKQLTIENANCILDEIKKGNGKEIIDLAINISCAGKARKNEPVIFALCLGLTFGDIELKNYIVENFIKVIRIGTHLFQFIHTLKKLRGMGKIVKKVISKFYLEKSLNDLVFQCIKYQNRTVEEGNKKSIWSHRDILRLMKFKTDDKQRDNLFHYITKNKLKETGIDDQLKLIEGFEKAKICKDEKEIIDLIGEYNLTREMIPTEFLNKPNVQRELFNTCGLTAIIRSLATWTVSGLINDYDTGFINIVCEKITNKDLIKKSRIHPLQIADAIKTYNSGHSLKGSSSWKPVQKIIDALDESFYLSFDFIEPTNKKIMLALDVSGSMSGGNILGSTLSPREVSAILAMVTMRTEKNYIIKGFSHTMIDLPISSKMRLNEVIRKISNIDFGNTDCALPMIDAMENNCKDIDSFIIYTDNETWCGKIHPCQALEKYRKFSGIFSKLIVVGMTATDFSIADKNDAGMFDIVGCSTDTPSLISEIIKG